MIYAVDMAATETKVCIMQNDEILIISIFQEAFGDPEASPKDNLADFAFEIAQMGQLLKYLGLAKASARSDLGWKPEPMLMKIIAERLACVSAKNKFAAAADDGWNFIHALITHVTGLERKEHHNAIDCCRHALAALGLLQEVAPGARAYKPTRRLRDLMLRRCLEQPASRQLAPSEAMAH
jgi:hypothetical protein